MQVAFRGFDEDSISLCLYLVIEFKFYGKS